MTAIGQQHLQAHVSLIQREPARLGAMPDTRAINFYDADPYLQFVLRRRLSEQERVRGEPLLRKLGARLGEEIEDLAADADRHTPELRIRDRRGERVDEVLPSPAYQSMERIFYCDFGLAAMAMRPGVAGLDAPASLVLNDALIYLSEQVESGLFCPLSMTRALARTLLKFAPPGVVETYVPGLLATSADNLQTGAMFMTEKQAGSDLGATTTSARSASERAGWWELHGEKWFCSNVGADLILTLARPEGAAAGTRGLGLFLVPRLLPDGSHNSFRIERVKDKLGIRSFASGEVTFDGTLALMIGGPGQGWLQMTEMLNVTRLGCASAAAALCRRSFLESLVHARGRIAFGKPLADQPLMREQLLDMLLDAEALTALFFEGSTQLDAADHGDEAARVLARIWTPLAKYHVSEEARRVVAEGMEVRGGNAFIEDWPNARLLRDVHVQAIWEGTGNIAALDVGRALAHDRGAELLLEHLRERVDIIGDPHVHRAARLASIALARCADAMEYRATITREESELLTKRLTRQLARSVTAILLVEDAQVQADTDGNYRCLAQAARYLRRYVFAPRDGAARELDRISLDWFDAMVDWAPQVPAEAADALLSAMEAEV